MSQRRVLTNLSANVVAQAISKLFPIVAYAFAQRQLGTVAFGHALFAVSLVDWANPAIEVGSSFYGQIEVGKGHTDVGRMRQLTGELLLMRAINALVAAVALFSVVHVYYQEYQSTTLALTFMLLSTVADMNYVQTGLRSVWQLGVFSVISKGLAFALIVALVQDKTDATTFAVLIAGTNSAVSLVTFVLGVHRWRPRLPSWSRLMSLYRTMLPFACVVIFSYLLERFDYFLVEARLTADAVGLYGGVSRIYASIQAVIPAVTIAFGAEMLGAKTPVELSRRMETGLEAAFAVTLPIGIGACFVSGELLRFIYDDQYVSAGTTFALLCFALIPHAFSTVVGLQALMVHGKIWFLSGAMVVAAMCGIAAESLLIGPYGIQGAASGVLISKVIMAGLVVCGAWSLLHRRRMVQLTWPYLAASLLMAALLWAAKPHNLFVAIALGGGIYVAAALLCNWQRLRHWRRPGL